MANIINASPPPSTHLATLAKMGYSFNTAVGDIIDNSITANATRIAITLLKQDTTYQLIIADNGIGMSEQQLLNNMVIGCKDPSRDRDPLDLGRFGAGLKTASFSQAKVLTVLSNQGDEFSGARWDTELVKEKNEWCLLHLESCEVEEITARLNSFDFSPRTLVIWDQINLLTDLDEFSAEILVGSLIKELHNHIGLHFHRFLSSSLSITINGLLIQSIDPFMKGEDGYAEGREEKIRSKNGTVFVKAHTLPRPSTLRKDTLELYGGAKNITEGQGIYLYRNKRLILGGGWHGVAKTSELHNLARIQVDITSKMDEEWQTDVKKSRLSIPLKVKQVLRRILPAPIAISKKKHTYAGKAQSASPLWLIKTNERVGEEAITYLVDVRHQSIHELLNSLDQDKRSLLTNYLRELSEELPVKHIYASFAAHPASTQTKENFDREMEELMSNLYE
jgi:hypothetical protein